MDDRRDVWDLLEVWRKELGEWVGGLVVVVRGGGGG